jgi:hypothetical protein
LHGVSKSPVDRQSNIGGELEFGQPSLMYCGRKYQAVGPCTSSCRIAYNNMINWSIGKTLFKIVYGWNQKHVVDLTSLPKLPMASVAVKHLAERVKATQEKVRQHLEKSYTNYKA